MIDVLRARLFGRRVFLLFFWGRRWGGAPRTAESFVSGAGASLRMTGNSAASPGSFVSWAREQVSG